MTTLARVRHTYADVSLFREFMEGSRDAPEWTSDLRVIRIMLEAVTGRIDDYVGRSFGPRTETHEYDIGAGQVRDSAEFPSSGHFGLPDYWTGVGGRLVELDDWLVSATTVTAYEDTARSASTVLTEGVTADYLLWPYNESPKWLFKMNEDSNNEIETGMKVFTILGVWGIWNQSEATGALVDTAAIDGSATSLPLDAPKDISPGMTLLIETEQMYVTAVKGSDATVERGSNGTTAASHVATTAVSVIVHPSDVVEVALDLAKNRWRERDAGTIEISGVGEGVVTRPGSEERAILKRLDGYMNKSPVGGVRF